MPSFKVLLSACCLLLSQLVFGQLEDLRLIIPIGHTDDIMMMELSHKSDLIATSGSVLSHYGGTTPDFASDQHVIIWNNKGIPLHSLKHETEIMFIGGFSWDDVLILTCDMENVYVWEVATGRQTLKLRYSVFVSDEIELGFVDSSYNFSFRLDYNQKVNVEYNEEDSHVTVVENILEEDYEDQTFEPTKEEFDTIIVVRTDFSDSTWVVDNVDGMESQSLPSRADTLVKLYGSALKNFNPGSYMTFIENENVLVYVNNDKPMIFNKHIKRLFEGKNRSALLDFANFSISDKGFYFENGGCINFMDLSSFSMNSVKYHQEDGFYKLNFYMDSDVLIGDFGCPFIVNYKTGEEIYFDQVSISKKHWKKIRERMYGDADTELTLPDLMWCGEKWSTIYHIERNESRYRISFYNDMIDENTLDFTLMGDRMVLNKYYLDKNAMYYDYMDQDTTLFPFGKPIDSLTLSKIDGRTSLNTTVIGSSTVAGAYLLGDKEILLGWDQHVLNLALDAPLNTGGGKDRAFEPDQIWLDLEKQCIVVNELYQLEFFDLAGKALFRFIPIDTNGFLFVLPTGHYALSDPALSKELYYCKSNTELLHFDQLDPIYNRPDLVLAAIGKTFGLGNQAQIELYRQAFEKRMQRLGLSSEEITTKQIEVPDAQIVSAENASSNNTSGFFEAKIHVLDSLHHLVRFNVLVNEVPLYGKDGISIAALNRFQWDTTVTIPLSVGENKIQVSVMNDLGLENFRYPTYVTYNPEHALEQKTLFIGIGVNEFKDPAITDLRYCVKDVRDLSKELSLNANVDTIMLLNDRVTKEAVLQLKERLMRTTVNDRVIISCSSHGFLDDANNFYLAMHDMSAEHPEEKGLTYEDLTGLLDGIPARSKLLLLDACNSGENEVPSREPSTTQVKSGVVRENARGAEAENNEGNTDSSFEMMMELFVNVNNPTGTVVIAAAGGQQSALEAINVNNKVIENGAFTYSLLECLRAGLSGDELTVNQLKQYVEKRVLELTDGQQKPVSRQETLEVDWRIK